MKAENGRLGTLTHTYYVISSNDGELCLEGLKYSIAEGIRAGASKSVRGFHQIPHPLLLLLKALITEWS